MEKVTAERLSRLLSDAEPDTSARKSWRRSPPATGKLLRQWSLAEGWFSFFLLALVVYSTIWCVQAVGWVNNLGMLTPVTALGLLLGVIAAKQKRVLSVLMHALAVVLALGLAFWLTCASDYAGNASALLSNIQVWFSLAFGGGTSSDDSIFLLLILALGFLLAYTSTWLVYRTRSPWLMLVANAVVMLINLNYISTGYIIFLLIFLLAALLLLLRLNLYESSTRWQRLGLRCSEDLHWEFMQAGVLISLAVLVFSWLLPWGYTSAQAAQIWSANPIVAAQNAWNRLVSVNVQTTPQNHGSFASTLLLGGSPNLANTPVFQLKTTDGSQYLMSVSYDSYNAQTNSWSNGPQSSFANPSLSVLSDGSADLSQVTQTVTVINPPAEEYPYLFGAPQIVAVDQNTHVATNKSDDEAVAWLRDNGKLAAGDVYTVVSYVSDADVQTLRSVPMPQKEPSLASQGNGIPPLNYFDSAVLKTYTQVPSRLDPAIKALAERITQGIPDMYDKVAALENYLRTNYTYDATISSPPPGVEATSWFLFQEKRGYCNYFATAMTLMARDLGIPARVAVGYTSGTVNAKTEQRVITGTDAHAWTQVYFAGYGWINFEPTAQFPLFLRPLHSSQANPGSTLTPTGTLTPNKQKILNLPVEPTGPGISNQSTSPADVAAQIRLDLEIVLVLMVVLLLGGLIYFRFWWRRLFSGLSLPGQIYGRVCTLAGWAGVTTNQAQTPFEQMHTLAQCVPEDAVTFERLGDIYTRERWADPQSAEHPARNGDAAEIPGLWRTIQPHLVRYVLRHPVFLRQSIQELRRIIGRLFSHRSRSASSESVVVVEEHIQ
jgi:transglutaminase-like putative cysteine protease